MTTPSGQISLSNVNTELGYSATALITMNDAAVRTLAGVGGSGTIITMQNLQGKSNQFNLTISSNQSNYDLRSAAVSAGWNQTTKLAATINSGVYVYSTSTSSAGLTISGSFPGGVTLTNNGYILGQGGNGGYGNRSTAPYIQAGFAGGLALSVSSPVSITNNGVIGGGGGGGGGGGVGGDQGCNPGPGGGGGGGGQTGLNNSSGGAGGSTSTGSGSPGGSGTSSGAGSGGAGAGGYAGPSGAGGNGGSWGNAGSSGSPGSGGGSNPGAAGGSAGAATSGSATYITWVATGTRYGAIN